MFDYWLARGGQRFGPYSVHDLQRMCAQGQATVADTEFVFLVLLLTVSYSALSRIRRALLAHYTLAQPIYLRLSASMTFFFGVFYLQHHFSRIAQWKRTGYLQPQ